MNGRHRLLLGMGLFLLLAVAAAACGGGADEGEPALPATRAPAAATDSPAPEATNTPVPATATAVPVVAARTGDEELAPELRAVRGWINSKPFTIESQRGNVVLVDFWTYTCINCIRTLPYLRSWHEKYADKGLVILGVHTPEFEFEKIRQNVIEAVRDFGIKYAVAQDNDYGTWRAFDNKFWPAKYLIDKDGYIRYTHFGEGAYEETEQVIRDLLSETGVDLGDVSSDTRPEPEIAPSSKTSDPAKSRTRELYAGYERNYGALLSGSPPYVLHEEYYQRQNVELEYKDPGEYRNHFLYLQGLWRNGVESVVHGRETEGYEDYIAIMFYGTSVNAVMGPEDSEALSVRLTIDGAPLKPEQAGEDVMYDDDGNSYVFVDEARMYRLVDMAEFEGHQLRLSSNSQGMALFAFTFGSYQGGEPEA